MKTKQTQNILFIGIGLVVWNALVSVLGLWHAAWWLALLVNFILIVILAQKTSELIPVKYKPAYDRLLAIGFPILLLISWELIVGAEILSPRWFPPPSKIAEGLWDLTVNYDEFNETSLLGRPWLIPEKFSTEGWPGVQALFTESHVWATLFRVFTGFVIGAIPAILVGIIMGINETVRTMLDTTMSAVYVLPKIAIFPLMMLIFPNPFGDGPKIAVVAISAFFLVAINTMTGVRDIDPVYIEAGKNYGANRWQMFQHVIIPGAMPVIFAGLRLALGTALVVIVAIEFVRAKTGVGFVIFYHWNVMETEKMYAGLFMVMVLGIFLTYLLQWIERRLMPWRR